MENPEEVRLWISAFIPMLIAVITGGFLVFQQRVKDKAQELNTFESARKTGEEADKVSEDARKASAETAKQITDAAGGLIKEYQDIMKSIKEQYKEQILSIQEQYGKQIESLQKEIDKVKKSNDELTCLYNDLLVQNTVLLAQNLQLTEKVDILEKKVNGGVVPC